MRRRWQPIGVARTPLPVALDLGGIYEQMLRHLAIRSRSGESLILYVERVNRIRCKEIECRKLEGRLDKEVQFHRKVELNAALRIARADAELQQP
jgi:hypothetical protein